MLAHLASQRHWLTAERLPGYAPDLNPVESIFGNVKGRELANHCGPELATLAQALRTGLGRVRRRPAPGARLRASRGLGVVACPSSYYTRLVRRLLSAIMPGSISVPRRSVSSSSALAAGSGSIRTC